MLFFSLVKKKEKKTTLDHSKHMQFSFSPPLRKQLNSCKTIQGGTDWQEQKFDLSKI